jgi:CRISPR/Cas system endoribonuclease Cas6 (RAMP superfamily)
MGRRIYPYQLLGWVYQEIQDTAIGRHYHKARSSAFTIKEIHPEQDGSLVVRLVFLDDRVMHAFFRRVHRGREVRLGQDFYCVAETALHHEDHPKAEVVSYDSLISYPVKDHLEVNFQNTAFHNGRNIVTLPDPGKVVNSLLSKWNEVSPYDFSLQADFRRQLASGLRIISHDIHSVVYSIRRDIKLPAFSGRVVYRNVHDDPRLQNILNILLHYAPYSGVGWKCSYGMGSVSLHA